MLFEQDSWRTLKSNSPLFSTTPDVRGFFRGEAVIVRGEAAMKLDGTEHKDFRVAGSLALWRSCITLHALPAKPPALWLILTHPCLTITCSASLWRLAVDRPVIASNLRFNRMIGSPSSSSSQPL